MVSCIIILLFLERIHLIIEVGVVGEVSAATTTVDRLSVEIAVAEEVDEVVATVVHGEEIKVVGVVIKGVVEEEDVLRHPKMI